MPWTTVRPEERLGLCRARVPVILQQARAECGLAALAMVAAFHGKALTMRELRRRTGSVPRGLHLAGLLTAAQRLQLVGRPLRLTVDELPRLTLPAVLHWRMDHFVVLVAVARRTVTIHDPACGRRRVRRSELHRAFTGIALELRPAPQFERRRGGRELRLIRLLGSVQGLGRYLALMLLLLLVTQVLTLVPPIATQLLIDEVVLGQDQAWLMTALAGLASVMLAGVILEAMRRWVGLYAGTRVAADCLQAAVAHLFRLPAAFLRERHLGDILSKLESLAPLRQLLTETAINGAVQLAIIASTIAVMCWYSARLAAVSVAGWVLVTALNASLLPASRRHAEQAIVHAARQDSSLLESLRAAESIRALDLGRQRLSLWQEHFFRSMNARVRRARLAIWSGLGTETVLAAEHLFFLGVGITAHAGQQVSLGVLFAFLALRNRLNGAASQLLAAVGSLHMARIHVQRVSDIVLAEAAVEPGGGLRRPLLGRLTVTDLGFRYAHGPWVFRGFHCDIPAGSMAVVSGPSGCGKTSLLRLLHGAEPAAEGTVAYDGVELTMWDMHHFRRQAGIVLQDDVLFQGTIADNICGFDTQPDAARLRAAATIADIWHDIRALPMQHRTLVGDMGSCLSGGQRQRIVLARALYRRPRLLILDEATSHLDVASERRILERLAALDITVISVAHRPDALRCATHVIDFRAACRRRPMP